MKINVTAEDIANGHRDHPNACPIAQALWRMFSIYSLPIVKGGKISFEFCDRRVIADMPGEVQKFVLRYDAGWTVEPFTFDLDVQPLE